MAWQPSAVELLDDAERRRRLAVRHALAGAARRDGPVAAARSVVALHGTDPASIVLSARARCASMSADDVGAALHERRELIRVMAMRRTIWVVPADLVAAAVAGPGARVAGTERKRLVADVETHGLHANGDRWLATARRQVLTALADDAELSMDEIRSRSPALVGSYRQGIGKKWESEVPIAPRVLTWMWADGAIVRSGNDGSWRSSRPLWAAADRWIHTDRRSRDVDGATGWTELVRRWLAAFGPGTERDIVWWLGATKAIVGASLGALDAVGVALSNGTTGWVLPDDLDLTAEPGPWGALLPALDPTTMGWKSRDWYLGPHAPDLVDSAGNAGPTIWWNGRIVGGWHQSEDGAVGMALLDDIGADGIAVLEDHAGQLEEFLGGRRVLMRFPSPLFQRSTGRHRS